ncbi:MAG: signal peptidase I [Candidatus Berkelbacteria bacterium]|nr:signal peptidase I [Candidatus Berkelbacteria bacterium]
MDKDQKDQNYFEEDEPEEKTPKASAVGSFFLALFDFVKTIVIVVILAFIIRVFIIQPFIVEGQSMEPTFHNNDYLITEKVTYKFRTPERGEIVIFHPPDNTSVNYIKRIIGLPGDTIEIKDGSIFVNSNELTEKYLNSDEQTALSQGNQEKITLGEKEYYVFGDNRNHSRDSRELGPIPLDNLVSRVWVRLLPLDSMKAFAAVNY